MLLAAYDVTDKVVFITGAGRGIDKGIADAPGIYPDPVTSGEEGARRSAERASQMVP